MRKEDLIYLSRRRDIHPVAPPQELLKSRHNFSIQIRLFVRCRHTRGRADSSPSANRHPNPCGVRRSKKARLQIGRRDITLSVHAPVCASSSSLQALRHRLLTTPPCLRIFALTNTTRAHLPAMAARPTPQMKCKETISDCSGKPLLRN